MKTVEQTRRELFEAVWAQSGMEKFKETAWWAFNAALDAVEIELPQDKPMSNNHEREAARLAHNDAVDACRAVIESTNLGIKVK